MRPGPRARGLSRAPDGGWWSIALMKAENGSSCEPMRIFE
jgi:hypothetical protein